MEYGMEDFGYFGVGGGVERRDIHLILSNLSSLLKRLFEVLISKLSKLVAFSLTIAFFGLLLYYPFAGLLMTRQGKGEEDGLVSQ